jgi:hypothetical protein
MPGRGIPNMSTSVKCDKCGHEQALGVSEMTWKETEYKTKCEKCGSTMFGFVSRTCCAHTDKAMFHTSITTIARSPIQGEMPALACSEPDCPIKWNQANGYFTVILAGQIEPYHGK